MAGSLQTAVLGMQAYQQMLDVTGNNIANADTVSFKTSRISFSDVFSRTLRQGVAGTGDGVNGGTNPLQLGLGVVVSSVDKNMNQGGFTTSDRTFDLAVDGEGFFVVNDGTQILYTRDGTFDVDSDGFLVDASTGFMVQRIGTIGEEDGFQTSGVDAIKIPYNTIVPGTRTEVIDFTGNLSADLGTPTTTKLQGSSLAYTLTAGGLAEAASDFADIDQLAGFTAGDTIDISGRDHTGTLVSATYSYTAGDSLQDLLDDIETAFGGSSAVTAAIDEGMITLKDDVAGYSMLDLDLSCSVSGLEDSVPGDFDYVDVGGAAAQTTNITIYDLQGRTHSLTATFVRQAADENIWDLVINNCADSTGITDRRIAGIQFDDNGTLKAIDGTDGFGNTATTAGLGDADPALDEDFGIMFPSIGTAQTIEVNLGTPGLYDGLTQLGGTSSAGAIKQDGYGNGSLQSVTVDGAGVVRGTFSNGITLEIAALRLAVFDNPQGLQTAGSNYYRTSPAVGSTVNTQGLQGRAGRIRQNVLEDSNVDIASEFTRLIVAQRGFQVNSRTVHVTNGMFQNLTMLVS